MQRMQRWLACLLCCFSFGSMAENIGVSELAVSSRFSDRLVMARIWYPAGENAAGERVSVGGNAVFAGVAAQADAAVSAGRFPLVVISHGGLQSAPDNISWLAAALAGQGYLVAVVNAPQVRGSNMTPPDELWLRPLDISAAIDQLQTHERFRHHIADAHQVSAIGSYFGAYAVMRLAGMQVDTQALRRVCATPEQSVDCMHFARQGTAWTQVDRNRLAQPYRDGRITQVLLLKPELAGIANRGSLNEIKLPVDIAALGKGREKQQYFDGAVLAGALPNVETFRLPEADVYDVFAVCKPRGVMILREEGDDGRV